MFYLLNFMLCVSIICFVNSKQLPPYITACHQSDPDLRKCIFDHAIETIPHLILGDKDYGIPVLKPLKIESVEIDSGANLKLKIKDITVNGIDTAKILDFQIDLDKRIIKLVLGFDYLEVIGTYEMDGNILILPIKGTGPMNMYLEQSVATMDYNFEYFDKDGSTYTRVPDAKLEFKHKNIKFKFDNLFNGDKTLGDNTNKFLNENWEEVIQEIGPSVRDIIKTIVLKVINAFCSKVAIENIFPK